MPIIITHTHTHTHPLARASIYERQRSYRAFQISVFYFLFFASIARFNAYKKLSYIIHIFPSYTYTFLYPHHCAASLLPPRPSVVQSVSYYLQLRARRRRCRFVRYTYRYRYVYIGTNGRDRFTVLKR